MSIDRRRWLWFRASSTHRSDPFLMRCSRRVRPLKITRQADGRGVSMASHISFVTIRTEREDWTKGVCDD